MTNDNPLSTLPNATRESSLEARVLFRALKGFVEYQELQELRQELVNAGEQVDLHTILLESGKISRAQLASVAEMLPGLRLLCTGCGAVMSGDQCVIRNGRMFCHICESRDLSIQGSFSPTDSETSIVISSRAPRIPAPEPELGDEEPPVAEDAHPSDPISYEETDMSSINQAINSILDIDGAFAAAIVDYESGMALGSHTTSPAFNIEVAAAGNTEVIRAKLRVKKALGIGSQAIDDVLITLDEQYHVIRPLKTIPNLFVYAAFDKDKANLAMARTKIKQIESELKV